MIDFPYGLPGVLLASFQGQSGTFLTSNPTISGPPVFGLVTRTKTIEYAVSWSFSLVQFTYFNQWWKEVLWFGSRPFNIYLPLPEGLKKLESYLPEFSYVTVGKRFNVSAILVTESILPECIFDEYSGYTTLLIHSDDIDGVGEFFDSSNSELHIIVTNVTHSLLQKKFGKSSIYFNGVDAWLQPATNALPTPDNDAWNFGSGSFSIDLWTYAQNNPGNLGNVLCVWGAILSEQAFRFVYDGTTGLLSVDVVFGGVQQTLVSTTSVASGWHHVAVSKDNSNFIFYVDGVVQGSFIPVGSMYNTTISCLIGANISYDDLFKGYIDEIRFTKGMARWGMENFVPPTKRYCNGLPIPPSGHSTDGTWNGLPDTWLSLPDTWSEL